ncbi:Hypothetical_protein [Hexamita inflata]|uniref:Hypothetical_protein n=1 Tax=Hexamita inflata TaxID=28002 RepID=A0AA86PV86_9EUKA|nr:Hypothetical protein HINF_LOCUS31853 [Hexamita inflata]
MNTLVVMIINTRTALPLTISGRQMLSYSATTDVNMTDSYVEIIPNPAVAVLSYCLTSSLRLTKYNQSDQSMISKDWCQKQTARPETQRARGATNYATRACAQPACCKPMASL